ncbi:MAG: VIT domain-containing protein, partial [Planctomycetota bacterium]
MQTDTVRMEKVRTRARVLTFVATLCLLLAGIACERRSASPSGASSTASVDAPAGRSDLQQLDVPTDLADDLDSNGTPYRNDAPAGVLLPAPTTTSGPDQVERLDETDPLAVTRLAVNVHVVGRLSITTVDQTFHNNTSMRMEGRYYFPLPAGSSLARFAMYVGDSLMEGEFLERLQARGIYESILRQKRDPALLEMMEGNTFRARVFPIEAHGDKRIILAYSQYLPQEADGTVLYRYPLNVAYHASRPLDHFSIDGIVTGCGDDLTVVERSTGFGTRLNDERNARRETGRACHFSASATTFRPPSDFTLAIRSRQLASNSGLASAGTGDDDADYFVASFAVPPPPPADRRPVDVTFLIDTSAGVARRTYKRALQMAGDAWSRLEASDGVSIMTFDIAARPHGTFAGGAARATAWLDHELGNDPLLGGTNLVGAVSAAIDAHAAAGSAHDHHIVIVSDGIATLGEFRPDDVRQAVQQQLAGNDQTRISALAVGSSIDELVLSALAGAFRGTVVPAHDGVDMHRAVSELVGAIATPPARVVSIAMKGGTVSDLRPGNLPSVNARATICGRFRLPQDASPVLQVLIERGAQRQLMDVPLTRTSSPLVARHWAVETANEAQRNPAGVPDGFDIIAHSRRYRILTQATAVLVLETEQDYRRFGITRIHAAPEDTEMLLAARLSATPAAPAAPEQPTDEPADEPVEEPAAPSPEAAPAASAAPAPATPVDEQMPDDLYPADPVLRARFNAQSHPTLDAANVLAQLVVRQDKNNPAVAAQAARLLRQLPAANEPDELYWYFGTHAMFQLGNRWWSRWEASVGPAVVTNQVIAEPVPGCRADQAPRHGSWNPDGAWSQRYGRVYATAMSVLTLAVYYRYEKVGGAPGAPEPPPADPAPASPDAPAQAQAGDSSGDADRHAPIQLQNPDPTPPAHDDPQADRDVRDDHNEDPTNDPTNADLRPNPTPDSSNVESPYPNQGFNGSLGMGGNIGGGGGSAGGSGGHRYRRASGGGGHRSVQNTMLSLRFLADSQNIDGSWPADAGQLAINLRTAGRLGVEQALSL